MKKRRTHADIRKSIVLGMTDSAISINKLAISSKVDWYSTERHLNYLKGRGIVEEVVSYQTLRLVVLTKIGSRLKSVLKNESNEKKIGILIKNCRVLFEDE